VYNISTTLLKTMLIIMQNKKYLVFKIGG